MHVIHFTQVSGVKESTQVKQVRFDIPDDLHKALKQKALDESLTLKALVTKICEQYVGIQTGDERKGTSADS